MSRALGIVPLPNNHSRIPATKTAIFVFYCEGNLWCLFTSVRFPCPENLIWYLSLCVAAILRELTCLLLMVVHRIRWWLLLLLLVSFDVTVKSNAGTTGSIAVRAYEGCVCCDLGCSEHLSPLTFPFSRFTPLIFKALKSSMAQLPPEGAVRGRTFQMRVLYSTPLQCCL